MAAVELIQVQKRFGDTQVVHDVNLTIPDGKFVALVGPSGCGKTTTLRMIAGLEEVSEGDILIDGEVINDVPPKDRDIAMVFQSYALYPHMTVSENMSFGLRLRGLSRVDIQTRVKRAAEILDISELLDRRPKALSGGQRQRVAMGRAIVRDPKVFLFDEPLSNLDAKLRVHMRTEIKRIHQQLKTTTVYVTHDQVEAMTLADFVVVMNKGRIEQIGTPQQLYRSPQTRFVAGFIGSPTMNFIACTLDRHNDELVLTIDGGIRLPVPADRVKRYEAFVGRPMLVGLRPEHLTEVRGPLRADMSVLRVKADVVEPLGMETMVFFRLGNAQACARLEPSAAPEPGEFVELMAHLAQIHLIDPQTDVVV